MLVLDPASNLATPVFDELDTSDLTKPIQQLGMPTGLLANADGRLDVVGWASDNNHLLLAHTSSAGEEFILYNRDNPTTSVNLSQLFKVSTTKMELVNDKPDQVYIYNGSTQALMVGDISNGNLSAANATKVIDFKALTSDQILYVGPSSQSGMVDINLWDGSTNYKLATIKPSQHYFLDAAQFQGLWYYLVNSPSEGTVNIYKDPVQSIKDPAVGKAVPEVALVDNSLSHVSFSSNGRFAEVDNGKDFVVYDSEAKTRYKYSLASQLTGVTSWMDAYHFIGLSAGKVLILDYDGTNQQLLLSANYPAGGLLSKDSKHLLTFSLDSANAQQLTNVSLLAGVDQPAQ